MSKKPLADKLVVKTFDYDGFDPELKSKLICLTGEINRAKTGHIKAALVMGEAISTANALLSEHGKHGRFGEWVERECGISKQTSYNYMWAWDRFGKSEHISHFDDGAMYALAAPQVPKTAVIEAEKLAKKGIRITIHKAKELLASLMPAKNEQKTSGKTGDHPIVGQPPEKPEKNTEEPPAEGDDSTSTNFDPAELESQPAGKVDVAELASPYRTWVRQLNACAAEFESLASDPHKGVHLCDKITRIKTDLRNAKETISQAEPVCACEQCGGDGCQTCYTSGFWTRAIQGSRKS